MVSPQTAANQAGVSRRTVMVSIESHRLKARRDNRNRWQIDPDDLSRWISERDTVHDTVPDSSSVGSTDTSGRDAIDLRIANARLEAQLEAANVRIMDLEKRMQDRDADYREVLSLLTDERKPKGFFQWLIAKIDK